MAFDLSETLRGVVTTVAAATVLGVGTVAVNTSAKVEKHDVQIERIQRTEGDIDQIKQDIAEIKTGIAVLTERTKELDNGPRPRP